MEKLKNFYKRKFAQKKTQYYITKIKLNDEKNSDKKSYLDNFYNEPSSYFNTFFNGRPVIIGNKHVNTNFIDTKKNNNKNYKFIKGQYRFEQNEKKALNEMRRESIQKKNISVVILPKNKTFINDEDLDFIYDKFKYLKKINQKNNSTKMYDHQYINSFREELIKNEIKHCFNLQNKIIEHKKNHEKNDFLIANRLSKKLNKPIESLLMSQSNLYRNKQEYKNTISNELKNLKPLPLFRWMTDLRSDNEDHYVNVGTNNNPKWHIYYKKNKLNNEIIRKPEINNSLFTYYSRNSDYIKSKLPFRTFNNLNKTFKNVDENLKTIFIEGNDLLDFEMDLTKKFKGKKIISLKNDNNYILTLSGGNSSNIDQTNNTITYKKNTDTKNFLKNSYKSLSYTMTE